MRSLGLSSWPAATAFVVTRTFSRLPRCSDAPREGERTAEDEEHAELAMTTDRLATFRDRRTAPQGALRYVHAKFS